MRCAGLVPLAIYLHSSVPGVHIQEGSANDRRRLFIRKTLIRGKIACYGTEVKMPSREKLNI